MMPESLLSICIPTFNRADLLQETLCHLEAVLDPSFEIVVSNNCSEDHTIEVLEEFGLRWANLKTLTLSKNVPALQNFDVANRLATSKYIYNLCDDDRINYDGIINAVRKMESNEDIIGVFGNYQEWDKKTNTIQDAIFIKDEKIFSKGNKQEIFLQFSLLWFPIMKRAFFQRHHEYDPHQWGMWPLVGKMLDHGSVAVIPDIFYKHADTIPRMEYHLTEGWYHDMHRSQYEVYIGDMGNGSANNALLVSSRVTPAYAQGLRFALIKKDFVAARFFLRRCRAYGTIDDGSIQKLEQQIMNNLISQQISELISLLPNIKSIALEKHGGLSVFESALSNTISELDIDICEIDESSDVSDNGSIFYIFWDISNLKKSKIYTEISGIYYASFIDLFNSNKITDWTVDNII